MKHRKVYLIVLKALIVLLCCLSVWIFISTKTLFMQLCRDNLTLDIDSISIDAYSNTTHINNIRDKEFVDIVLQYLQESSFAGYIDGEGIRRHGDMKVCRLVIACNGGKSYEVHLSSGVDDVCYIKPLRGAFSNRIYIKIRNCENLYNYIWSYITTTNP